MNILHCCLSERYIDDYNYQENILPVINKLDGHTVKIIASTEIYDEKVKLAYTKPGKYFTKDGIEINRIPYRRYLPHFIMKKVRRYKKLYSLIEEFSPDVIMCHGMCLYDLTTMGKYKKKNPNVKFYTDSHEDKYNSGTNWLSKNILHKIFYKNIIKKSYNYIDKIFYITYEAKKFLQDVYSISDEKVEFYPLGGIIPNETERYIVRNEIRKQFNLKCGDILLLHSGRLDNKLKRTEDLIKAFIEVHNDKLKLFIAGSMNKSTSQELKPLISSDERINYLGWKKGNELMEYLCACDLYVQPGTKSCTMQIALCCGSAAAIYPYESYKYLLKDNVFYIETIEDMMRLFENISANPKLLEEKRADANKAAHEVLDYKILASRLYK